MRPGLGPDEHKKAVVFVHGFFSNSSRWKFNAANTAYLPHNIGTDIWGYDYGIGLGTLVPAGITSVYDIGKDINQYLLDNNFDEYDEITFVAHSYGAVMLRAAVKQSTDPSIYNQAQRDRLQLIHRPYGQYGGSTGWLKATHYIFAAPAMGGTRLISGLKGAVYAAITSPPGASSALSAFLSSLDPKGAVQEDLYGDFSMQYYEDVNVLLAEDDWLVLEGELEGQVKRPRGWNLYQHKGENEDGDGAPYIAPSTEHTSILLTQHLARLALPPEIEGSDADPALPFLCISGGPYFNDHGNGSGTADDGLLSKNESATITVNFYNNGGDSNKWTNYDLRATWESAYEEISPDFIGDLIDVDLTTDSEKTITFDILNDGGITDGNGLPVNDIATEFVLYRDAYYPNGNEGFGAGGYPNKIVRFMLYQNGAPYFLWKRTPPAPVTKSSGAIARGSSIGGKDVAVVDEEKPANSALIVPSHQPVMADIDKDGIQEIVTVSGDGVVYVLKDNARTADTLWSCDLSSISGYIDDPDHVSITVSGSRVLIAQQKFILEMSDHAVVMALIVLDYDGRLIDSYNERIENALIVSPPAVSVFNGVRKAVLVVNSFVVSEGEVSFEYNLRLHELESLHIYRDNPARIDSMSPENLVMLPTVVDLDADGTPEIIVGDAVVFKAYGVQFWDNFRGQASQGVAVADINGDNIPSEIVTGFRALDASGGIIWENLSLTNRSAYSLPIVVDLDRDGNKEVLVVDESYTLHVINAHSGDTLDSFRLPPHYIDGKEGDNPFVKLSVGDVEGNSIYEIFAVIGDLQFVLSYNGRQIELLYAPYVRTSPTSTVYMTPESKKMPIVGDIDGDGRSEVIIGSYDEGFSLLQGKTLESGDTGWPQFQHDSNRSGNNKRKINVAPIANAQIAVNYDFAITEISEFERSNEVLLSGDASIDPDNYPESGEGRFLGSWRQISGPDVSWGPPQDDSGMTTSFTLGADFVVNEDTVLMFELYVTDGIDSDTDTVTVTVLNTKPIAEAGISVSEIDEYISGATPPVVSLYGSNLSGDGGGSSASYSWNQVGGPSCIRWEDPYMESPNIELISEVSEDTILTFELTVYDGLDYSTDTVSLLVRNVEAIPELSSVSGVVYYQVAKKLVPVKSASIIFFNTTEKKLHRVKTDEKGRYAFKDVEPGEYILITFKQSFPHSVKKVSLKSNEQLVVKTLLKKPWFSKR